MPGGIAFHHWQERLTASRDEVPERVRYTRKSTEGDDRQATSHEQQAGAMDKKWDGIERAWYWADSCSGTSFDRPAFQDLLDFCKSNRRSPRNLGRIEMYDPSRFGRTLDEEGKPDIISFISVMSEFERYGWVVEFVTVQRTGDSLVDFITMALYAYAAALYSKSLSENVMRGRLKHAKDGWWVGGTAPWGTKRFDTEAKRELRGRERSVATGRTILVPDPAVLKLWARAVKRILAGASLDAVGAHLFEKGVRGPRDGKMGHAAVRNFLTNVALVGIVEYDDEKDEHGHRERRRAKAKWPPMVDVDLFAKITERLHGHRCAQAPRRRRRRELFPITPVCAHCGVEYNGNRLSAAQGSTRGYAHAQPNKRMDPEGFARRGAPGLQGVVCGRRGAGIEDQGRHRLGAHERRLHRRRARTRAGARHVQGARGGSSRLGGARGRSGQGRMPHARAEHRAGGQGRGCGGGRR
jgi:DNA invertase Pin-like site-specific DNA recombinase